MLRQIYAIVLSLTFTRCWGGTTTRSFIGRTDISTAGCTSSCLRCAPQGCLKCPGLIVYPARTCVDNCPFGYAPKWSTMTDFMGLVCVHNGNFLGLASSSLTVLAGVVAGVILCLVAFAAAGAYFRWNKRRRLFLGNTATSDTSSESEDSPERKDFLKQLETLRPYAQSYLDMLNDTRLQIRQLHADGDTGAMCAYKPVLRDLAKILLLLNRPQERIAMPDDWEHLFSWAEKALKRYKRMSDTSSSSPQVVQLINFLQSPAEDAVRATTTTMSTFKPDQVFGSSMSFDESLNPQWKFEYSLVGGTTTTTSEFDPVAWKSSQEFLGGGHVFLEDDFYQLGFRPQDEITTEL